MPIASTARADICYETFGDPGDPAVVLIMGLGGQMIAWDAEFCEMLVDEGFFVVRFDNRDVGLSSCFDGVEFDFSTAIGRALSGEKIDVPYTLSDMANDTVGLLDHLGIQRAHLVGVSMGGMIAQTIAAEYPERAASLTSIMSSTGSRRVGQPTPEAMAVLFDRPPDDRDGAIESSVRAQRVIGSPRHFDEERTRALAGASYDRRFDPDGIGRQLAAIYAAGNRSDQVARIRCPTLVIHGTEDPLIDPSGGRHTAEVIDGARLVIIDGMAHDLPRPLWPEIVAAIGHHARLEGRFGDPDPAS